eukprot:Amastigsp_a515857_10.p3 type:complete len:191 gc:universal Amastigsp_a515857_10:341-913(+)
MFAVVFAPSPKSSLMRSIMWSARLTNAGTGSPTLSRNSGMSLTGPKYATRPWVRNMTLSKSARTDDDGWWMTATTARCCRTAMSLMLLITLSAEVASRPEVGSSRKRIEGSATSSVAIEVRRRSPPETPRMSTLPTLESWTRVRPRSVMTDLTRRAFSARETLPGMRKSAEYSMFSLTVSEPRSASSCIT